jgi:uncharacterized protein (DUF927 family)
MELRGSNRFFLPTYPNIIMASLSLQFLNALGYSEGDRLNFRGFYDKKDPRQPGSRCENKTGTLGDSLETLKQWEADKRGVYMVVNRGGRCDAKITDCLAIFCEWDNLEKSIQVGIWRDLGLPEPTMQIETGGKSIHCYWVFSEPIPPEQWKPLQADLLEYADGDRTIKNPSRVMRMPGFKHAGTGGMATILNCPGHRYAFDDLRAKIPTRKALKAETLPRSDYGTATDDEILEALKFIPARVPNQGNYAMHRNILWALKAHFGEERAIAIMENHSPDGWNVAQVCRSGGEKIGVGTLFFHAKQHGWEPKPKGKPRPISEGDPDFETHKPHFISTPEKGVQWVIFEKDENGAIKTLRTTVGRHLKAIAYVESPEQHGAALYLEFIDIRNRTRHVTIDRASIVDGAEFLRTLVDMGYGFVLKQKNRLRDYLNRLGSDCEKTYTIAPKTGWVNGSFVTVDSTYGDPALKFGRVEPPTQPRFRQSGTLDDWKTHVAAMARGNSRLIFALGCALCGPLLEPLGIESGGIHLYGETSKGKTTAIAVAASVMGSPKTVVTQWRATANGLEGVALEHNDLTLFLDEIGQGAAQDIGKAAYMLANGQSKIRMQRNRKIDDAKTWRTLFLSTGEHTLTDYLTQAGLPVKGGQENRLPSIPACPANGHGVFEEIHGNSAGEFVRGLEQSTAKFHGAAFPAFMTQLIPLLTNTDFFDALVKRHAQVTNALGQMGEGDEVIGRVAKRFAAIQTALEVAASLHVIPLTTDEIGWGVLRCFTDWIDARGGVGSIEVKQACDRIQHLLVSNQQSDRIQFVGDGHDRVVRNLLAHRKGDEFWVPTAIFNREFVGDCNRKNLIKELQARGWLMKPTQNDRFTLKRCLNGTDKSFFVIDFPTLENSTGVTGVTGAALPGMGFTDSRNKNPNGSHGSVFQKFFDGLSGVLPETHTGQHVPETPVNTQNLDTRQSKGSSALTPVTPVDSRTTGVRETQTEQGDSRHSRDSRSKMQVEKQKSIFSDDVSNEVIDVDEI